ncbi:hypothetical protein LX36DRAFT_211053 [Colletotrichum falcatum]|nr:hypothetical protein LX36DRAFT_211053 [Colletotrichum falcatum]
MPSVARPLHIRQRTAEGHTSETRKGGRKSSPSQIRTRRILLFPWIAFSISGGGFCCECCIKTIAYGGKQIKVAETTKPTTRACVYFRRSIMRPFPLPFGTPLFLTGQRRNAAPFHNASPSGLTQRYCPRFPPNYMVQIVLVSGEQKKRSYLPPLPC